MRRVAQLALCVPLGNCTISVKAMYYLREHDLYHWPQIQECLQKSPQQPINPHSQRLLSEQKKKQSAAKATGKGKGKAKAKAQAKAKAKPKAKAKSKSKQPKTTGTAKADTVYNVERKRYFQQPLERRITGSQHGIVSILYLCARLDDQFGPIFATKEKQARPAIASIQW